MLNATAETLQAPDAPCADGGMDGNAPTALLGRWLQTEDGESSKQLEIGEFG